jgi:hypothetical protein
MENTARQTLLRIASLALCASGMCSMVFAAPPGSRPGLGSFHSAASASPISHLDLRLPSGITTMAAEEKSSAAFPSGLHRHTMGQPEESDLPAPGVQASSSRIPGRAEEFARRVHREGLPVARLWENRSALVSLGLNQRGKPGLWLIQKTH